MASYDRINRRLVALAATQLGLITRDQARMAGLSSGQISGRLSAGRWVRVDRGVYAIAGVPATWQQRAWAAVRAGAQGAHASHLTAAALAGLSVAAPPQPHLTVGRERSTRLSGATVHSARLTPTDLTLLQGVPATTVPRTLIDCAGLLGPNRLQRLVDEAMHKRLVRPDQIPAFWDKARLRPGRAGEPRLRAALEPWQGAILPDSPPEARLRRQLRQWGYPEPALQVPVLDDDGTTLGRVDLGWPAVRVGLEYDSEEFHGPSTWASDEARQVAIERQGWRLLRVDKIDLRPGQPHLRTALARTWRAASAAA